jgi:alkylation response protein AidB-like acyl-CoA dehydrogenase
MTAPVNGPSAAELEAYRAEARAWMEAHLPRRDAADVEARKPWDVQEVSAEEFAAQRALQRRMYEAGYAGITWPQECGGQGLHADYERVFNEEARHFVLPDLGTLGGTTFHVCAPTMLAHASPEFLAVHVPRILAGEELVAQFFSDPDAGSDLAGVRTQAVRDGDRWILNGSKIWSSGAYHADIGMCLARTNWDVPKHRGLTWFAVPVRAPGVTMERIRQINGNEEFCQEFFDDVELTDADVIGEVNDGWTVTQTMLLFERGGGAVRAQVSQPTAVGLKADVLALMDAVGGWDDPAARDTAAQVHVDDLARAALSKRIGAAMAADPMRAASYASYGKLASGVFDPRRANLMMRIAGESAVAGEPGSPGAAAALALLNSRFMAIAGGTVQMQRNTIGEKVLGLPREPSFDSAKPFRDVVRDAAAWSGKVS